LVESEDLCPNLKAKSLFQVRRSIPKSDGRRQPYTAEKRKNAVNIGHEHHLFKLANIHGSEAEQKRKKR
jgi:CRISPR/Cas system-associated protein Cas10 (large subunit of type III CRISPR-Cas system)